FFIRGAVAADHVNEVLLERDRSFTVTFKTNSLPQFVQRSGSKQLSLSDDGNVAAQTLNDLEHVRGEKNRQSTRRQSRQKILQRARSNCVHTLERFIQKQYLG